MLYALLYYAYNFTDQNILHKSTKQIVLVNIWIIEMSLKEIYNQESTLQKFIFL